MITKMISAGTCVLLSSLLLGCASTLTTDAPAAESSASGSTSATTVTESEAATAQEPRVVQTVAQAEKYATEAEVRLAVRDCKRKMRRFTGSRIPRNTCTSASLFPGGWAEPMETTPVDPIR